MLPVECESPFRSPAAKGYVASMARRWTDPCFVAPHPCLPASSLQPAILVLIASPPARRAKRVCKLQAEQRFRTLAYVAVANCSRVTPSLRQSSITVTTLLQHPAARDSTYQSNNETTSRQRHKQLCRQRPSSRPLISHPTRETVQWPRDTPSSSV